MEISATEASRTFSDVLDAVEHRGERFTIVRRGRVVARLEPVVAAKGKALKELLRAHHLDAGFRDDVLAARGLLEAEERS